MIIQDNIAHLTDVLKPIFTKNFNCQVTCQWDKYICYYDVRILNESVLFVSCMAKI